MNMKIGKGRMTSIFCILIIAMAAFCVQLVHWQIFSGDYYEKEALTSTGYTITTDALRGEIFDVKGIALAANVTTYRVVINKLYIEDDKLNSAIIRLMDIFVRSAGEWKDELPIIRDKNGNYAFESNHDDEIEELKSKENLNMNPYSTAEECMNKLVEKYGCQNSSKQQQRKIVGIRYTMDINGYSRSKPYIFADNISRETMTAVSENMQDVQGITVESSAVRKYIDGTTAPHILGVTGLISEEEYNELKDKGYVYNDIIGKSGIEAVYEENLRGESGSKTYDVGFDGKVKEVSVVDSKPGDSICLTIDSDYQKCALKALEEAVKEANDYAKETGETNSGSDCVGAAMVVLDVEDFSVICSASYPSFDNEKYYEDYTKLLQEKSSPLFDRAFMGAIAPGSTFKPLVASAALQERVITINSQIDCEGVYTKNGLNLWCMNYHGSINVFEAIQESCNVFFAETGRRLGIERLDTYAKRCGLGVKTGVEIQESSGTLAGPDYSKKMGSEWYDSFVSPASIGQSDNQFTPLQLATYAATIANDGVRLKTHVVDKIVSYSGDEIKYESKSEIVDNMGVSKIYLKNVQKAMNMAASSYEALYGFEIPLAGKTGTAENNGSDHANFICYAPYDNPKIALAVMVEHGGRSRVAVNAARKFLTEYFTKEGMIKILEEKTEKTNR